MRRVPHRRFGLFRGWTGSVRHEVRREQLGGPDRSNGLPEARPERPSCMEMPMLARDHDSSSVGCCFCTVLD